MSLESLLDNLVVQTAIAPLLVALVSGLLFRVVVPRATGIGLILGFVAAAYLINGADLRQLSAVEKMVLATIAAAVAGALVEIIGLPARSRRPLLIALAVSALGWIAYKTLGAKQGLSLVAYSLGGVAYLAWLSFMLDRLRSRAAASGVLIPLGLGTGFCAMAGSSALMGQLGLAMAAAAGGLGLLFLFHDNYRVGAELTFPAAMAYGLLGYGAWLYASLPWYALPVLACVPLVALIPGLSNRAYWLGAAGYMTAGLLVAAAALFLIKSLAGDNSYGY